MKKIIFFLAVLSLCAQAQAHHASAPHFMLDERITVEGVITDLKLVNPHGYIYLDVTDENGETANWRCSLTNRSRMLRRGWTDDMFEKGKAVTLTGSPARREANHCFFRSLTTVDGITIAQGEDITGKLTDSSEGARDVGTDEAQALAEPPIGVPNGQPDFRGPWTNKQLDTFPGDRLAMGSGDGGRRAFATGLEGAPEPTAAGKQAALGYDPIYDDPSLLCHPGNIVSALTGDSSVNNIYQEEDRITLVYGYMDLVRTFHLDQPDHPDDILPGVAGHSIARWEDDVLVVHTVGFKPGVLFRGNGLMHSDQMEVVERFELSDDAQTLTRGFSVHDPLFLETDWVGETVMERTDLPMTPYNCISLEGANNERDGD